MMARYSERSHRTHRHAAWSALWAQLLEPLDDEHTATDDEGATTDQVVTPERARHGNGESSELS